MNFIQDIKDELRANQNRTEVAEYVADLFLNYASGSLSGGYHIEFSLESYDDAQNLSEILAIHEMLPKLIGRGERAVVYLKSGECLCNLLGLIGANKSLLKLHDEIILRDLNNNSNRRRNCDTANLEKQVSCAMTQYDSIRKLKESGELEKLSSKLQITAQARLNNPDASYEELAVILGISKSGVVNRLRKILD